MKSDSIDGTAATKLTHLSGSQQNVFPRLVLHRKGSLVRALFGWSSCKLNHIEVRSGVAYYYYY